MPTHSTRSCFVLTHPSLCRHWFPLEPPPPSFEAQTQQNTPSIAQGGFEAQPPNRHEYHTACAVLHVLDMSPVSPRLCRQYSPLRHVLARVRVPGVSHHGWLSGCSDPSAKTQQSSVTARARMIFTSAVDHHPYVTHLHITCRYTWLYIHNLMSRSVYDSTPRRYPLSIIYHQSKPQETSQHFVRICSFPALVVQ